MSREIDRLVAEKVMGWKVKMAMDGVTEYYDTGGFCEGKWVEDLGICEKDNVDVFKPSERIKDAWLVVEKLENMEIHTKINEKVWVTYKHQETSAKTATMAICKAALKAIEGDANG